MEDILNIILVILIMAVAVLAVIYIYMVYKSKNEDKTSKANKEEKNVSKVKDKKKSSEYTKIPIFDFMEFDRIEDNMIVQDNGQKYLMVIECDGVNYDLMSEMEKVAVEAGFVQFLNTLRYTIQIYTQTRTINIEESLLNYRNSINDLSKNIEQKKRMLTMMLQEGIATAKQIDDTKTEIRKLQNLYDYGLDVVDNIEKTSQNKNVLRKHYYIVVPCYSSEIDNDMLDAEEKRNMMFAELYTRAQSLIRTLYACSMKCRILNSYELADLLYVAYNRDESELYGIDKALKAGYNELYTTSQDVLDKKMIALNKKIEEQGLKLASQTVDELRIEKQKNIEKKEKDFDKLVKEMAEKILKENEKTLGKELSEEAIDKLNQTNEKGGNLDEEKTKKRTRRSSK